MRGACERRNTIRASTATSVAPSPGATSVTASTPLSLPSASRGVTSVRRLAVGSKNLRLDYLAACRISPASKKHPSIAEERGGVPGSRHRVGDAGLTMTRHVPQLSRSSQCVPGRLSSDNQYPPIGQKSCGVARPWQGIGHLHLGEGLCARIEPFRAGQQVAGQSPSPHDQDTPVRQDRGSVPGACLEHAPRQRYRRLGRRVVQGHCPGWTVQTLAAQVKNAAVGEQRSALSGKRPRPLRLGNRRCLAGRYWHARTRRPVLEAHRRTGTCQRLCSLKSHAT